MPVYRPSTCMLNQKVTTFTWSEKLNLKSSLKNNQKYSLKTKSDACFALRNFSHLSFHWPTWQEITLFSFLSKIIVSIRPNSFFTYRKKFKSVCCAFFARTRDLKILPLVKPSECICFRKTILSWKLKMVMKSMKLSTTFLHCLTKNWKNRSFMPLLWELTSKKLRSSSMNSSKSRKIWNKKPKFKMQLKVKNIQTMEIGMMLKVMVVRKNGNLNLKMDKTEQLRR